jgi:hypothetical protein
VKCRGAAAAAHHPNEMTPKAPASGTIGPSTVHQQGADMSDATKGRTASSAPSTPRPLYANASYGDDRGDSWVMFAGVMLALVGILNIVYGIAAIGDSTFFTANAKYVITDLNTWGWVVLVVGAIQFLAAFAIWSGAELGRWVGIISAACNAIVQMFFIPAFPLLSVTLFAVDVLVIYGLVTYGGHGRAGA